MTEEAKTATPTSSPLETTAPNGKPKIGNVQISWLVQLFRRGTIRTRLLIAFVSLVLLPAAAVSIGASVAGFQSGQQQVKNQLESVVTVKEAAIESWLTSLQTNLAIMLPEQEVAGLAEVVTQDSPAQAHYQDAYDHLHTHLTWMVNQAELFEEIFLIDLQGQVILSTDPLQEDKIFVNEIYFQEGLQRPYVHSPFYSPSLARLSVIAVRPLVDQQGQTIGVLAGRASAARLSEVMLEQAGLGQTGETYLVGANHALLTTAREYSVKRGDEAKYVRTEGVNTAIDDRLSGANLYRDFRGIPVVGVYHWFPELQVALLAEQEQSEAFYPLYIILAINIGVAIVAVLIAVVAALFVTRSIAAPLADLARAAQTIEAGVFEPDSLATVVERSDELGQFGRVFQRMAHEVYSREQQLKQQVQELKIVIDETKRQHAVAEITETDFFQDLTKKAQNLRERRKQTPGKETQ